MDPVRRIVQVVQTSAPEAHPKARSWVVSAFGVGRLSGRNKIDKPFFLRSPEVSPVDILQDAGVCDTTVARDPLRS